MRLERMQMALNVTYVTETELAISSAAMPPSYLFRPGSEVQEILLPGLPLSAMASPEYRLQVLEFLPGDVLLQISDGLPERLNPQDDWLGYDAVAECLEAHGEQSADHILNALLELGEGWATGRPTDDDITVVVLKHR